MLCTQKNGLKARHINLCFASKNFSVTQSIFVCQTVCQIIIYTKKLSLTYHRKTLINQA